MGLCFDNPLMMKQLNNQALHLNPSQWVYIMVGLLSCVFGLLLAIGIISVPHVIIIIILVTIIIIGKLNFLMYFTLILMFVPLSLGNIFKIKITLAAEPLIIFSFMTILFLYISSSRKNHIFSLMKNPFWIPILFYIIVLVINYLRYPLPPSSLSGVSEEMGGIRFYYEKIIIFIFFFCIAYCSETDTKFIRNILGIIVFMTSLANIAGILLYFNPNLDNVITPLYNNGIFAHNSFFHGSLARTIDPLTGAVRINIFWGTAIGFFILISNVIKLKSFFKIILLILYMIGLFLGATRSFFFGVIIALIIWTIMSKNKKLMYLFAGVGLIVLIVPTIISSSSQLSRLFYFPSDIEKLTTSRSDLFNVYWNDFRKNILFGVGVGATEIPKAASTQVYFFMQNLRFGGHGFFLGSLYTMGLLGLFPFLWFYYKTYKISFKLFRQPSNEFSNLVGMLCIMFIGYSFIPLMVGGNETYNQLFLLAGILAGLNLRLYGNDAKI